MTAAELNLARQCLRFSVRAYDEATIVDSATSTEVLVSGPLNEPDTTIISFRGSQEPKDYIYDARCIEKNPWPNRAEVRVHRGFDQGFRSVAQEILLAAQSALRIVCTGHSLGGARALECALYLKECGLPVSAVITFGAPRVGNAAFRDYYNSALHDVTVRFEAQGDPVPWMPLLVLGYRHAGRSAYLKNDGSLSVDPQFLEHVPALVQTALPQSANLPAHFLGLFKPHYLENYERLFAELKEAA